LPEEAIPIKGSGDKPLPKSPHRRSRKTAYSKDSLPIIGTPDTELSTTQFPHVNRQAKVPTKNMPAEADDLYSKSTDSNGIDLLNESKMSSHIEQRRSKAKPIPAAMPVEHYPVPATHRPFAHSSEDEFARILNFYGVQWLYEPRSFPLRWSGDRVVEMFTPDFYLPELDIYIELTTLKQNLVTYKNRKLRQLRELYPDIKARILYRKDIYRLLARYGFGPLVEEEVPELHSVLFAKPQIDRRIIELGRNISQDYTGQELVLVGVLRGVFCFMADLMRQVTLPLSVDFLSVSHYQNNHDDKATIQITKGPNIDVKGRHVLLVEDIVDTGMTLNYLVRYLQLSAPASLKVCTLLDKRIRRITDVKLDYVGFEAPDEFLVGYGLDYLEKYRNMPFIGVLKFGEQPRSSKKAFARRTIN
jgi:bifunctional protein TilS/HprT